MAQIAQKNSTFGSVSRTSMARRESDPLEDELVATDGTPPDELSSEPSGVQVLNLRAGVFVGRYLHWSLCIVPQ